ncbi:hypothetical protein [Variovorax sp. YR752]|uniref:hypothetical protein n=1 Tax=Variovorax sp. YR752 TaxID=1884383 RepID=UPI0031378314
MEDIGLLVLLEVPAPYVRAYPQETVITERLHAMVVPVLADVRMKDDCDVWMLTNTLDIDGGCSWRAVEAPLCVPRPHRVAAV